MDPDEKLEAAQLLVNEYGRVLEEHAAYMLKPQEALPTTKEEIKWALLVVAAWGKMTGQISDETLEQFCIGYGSLANFVLAAEARGDQRFSEAVLRGRQIDDWSGEAAKELIREIAESEYSSERRQQAIAEFAHLTDEFKQSLSKLIDKWSEAQE